MKYKATIIILIIVELNIFMIVDIILDRRTHDYFKPPIEYYGEHGVIDRWTHSSVTYVGPGYVEYIRTNYSVENYRYLNGDTLSDYEVIQMALDSQQFIYIPPGEYIIENTLSLYDRQNMTIDGSTSILIDSMDRDSVMLDIKGGYNITFKNMSFIANSGNYCIVIDTL